ncbi:MAG: hypothetical protein P8R42_05795 [Candidatus Binatia bacterium]|nr:hypothetical protein [Candidatus Binatia bacterium]
MNRALVRTMLVVILGVVASCGDGAAAPTIVPDFELEAPAPPVGDLTARPYVFHSRFPPFMGSPGGVFTLDRYVSFIDVVTAGVEKNVGFIPLTGVYVPRKAMAAWAATSAADYKPCQPNGKSGACSSRAF